jgi:hypothetical protein
LVCCGLRRVCSAVPRATVTQARPSAAKGFTLRHALSGLEAILGPRRRADNSGLSAHPPPAETH